MTTEQKPIRRPPTNVNARRKSMPLADLPEISGAEAEAEPEQDRTFPPDAAPAAALLAEELLEAAHAGPLTLAAIHEKLCKPFPLWAIEVKPGATTKDKTRALALAYVDPRVYFTRLDRLAGPCNWQVEYRPISDRAVLCRLTVLGVVREDIGECDQGDPNQATSAAMQAFKRACAAFGMGRYLYSLPQIWTPYDAERKQITNPEAAAQQIYAMAGLAVK
jgi:hypothetical protein